MATNTAHTAITIASTFTQLRENAISHRWSKQLVVPCKAPTRGNGGLRARRIHSRREGTSSFTTQSPSSYLLLLASPFPLLVVGRQHVTQTYKHFESNANEMYSKPGWQENTRKFTPQHLNEQLKLGSRTSGTRLFCTSQTPY